MKNSINRDRVKGFLHAEGMNLVNENGEQILLFGWGLGNWMLCEGYMWGLETPAFDRPRRIEQTLETLTGSKYAARFWKQYREAYITEQDLKLMADMGCNSLRVPISARLFMEEGPYARFLEEGFRLLDWLIDQCEKYGLYVFIDLHAAPGGQTGANIDDSADDLCRLFIDDAQFEKGLALWEEIARRYSERWIVGGYELLNEPIRPVRFEGDSDLDMYEPRLKAFYEQAIRRIRRVDSRHLIALEGIHWATDTGIFDHVYDDNMVIHFHRYACAPEPQAFEKYIETAKRLNAPLWLGETGENCLTWFSALMPMAFGLGISVTLWPWKKINCENSPCSFDAPEDWNLIWAYLNGGAQPEYEKTQRIFDQLLRNIRVENCRINERLNAQILRIPGCMIQGSDFDAFPGKEVSYHAEGIYAPGCYRKDTGMEIVRGREEEKQFLFDGPWRHVLLRLHQNEWAQYTVYDVTTSTRLEIACWADVPSVMEIRQGDMALGVFDLSKCHSVQIISDTHLYTAPACEIRLTVLKGEVSIERLSIQPIS